MTTDGLAALHARCFNRPRPWRAAEFAALLDSRSVPFCFVSGYGREHLPQGFEDAPLIQKPFPPTSLRQILSELLYLRRPHAAE